MRKRIALLMVALIFPVLLSGCVTFSTGGGDRASRGDEYSPTGKAAAYARGLGSSAPAKIWTDAGRQTKEIALKSDTFIEVAKKSNPAIVNIFSTTDIKVGIGDPLGIFSLPIGENGGFEVYSLGTGFFISPDGFLLTNAHVVAKADKINVFLHDRSEARSVQVIGVDPLTDLALLKVDSKDALPFLRLADSDAVEMGEMVVAIGNPLGLDYSITTGVISAKNRVLSAGSRRGLYEDFLQTSAQINPGNSGGPLLNLGGDVVGINTAMIAQAQGIGFALPSNMVKGLLPGLARSGKISRGYSGVGLAGISPTLAKRFGVQETKGAIVATVDPSGPAAGAGLSTGDVILAINGEDTETAEEASRKLAVAEAGKKITLTVSRRGQRMSVAFTTVSK